MTLAEVLVIIAFVLLVLAALRVNILTRVHLGWLGLAVLVFALWVIPIF